jgi:hypothetical protein
MTISRKTFASVLGLALASLTAVAARAQADDAKIQITSFDYVNNAGRVAEICGKVTGATTATLARVVVDVNTSNPGIYNVMVGKDGMFCTVVASYRGTANATLESASGKILESGVITAAAHQR